MMLQGGILGEERVVSSKWGHDSTTPDAPFLKPSPGGAVPAMPRGWIPKERLTLEQAIQGYTMGCAFAARREMMEGSIEVGKLADVILLSQDLFKIAPNQIGKTKVLITMAGGNTVYQDPS
jgi:predicted amidohydrolase YtcJ